MRSIKKFALGLVLAAAAAGTVPALARDGKDGKPMVCINLMSMDDSPVINDHTILVKMKGGKVPYKRIDLAGPCSGIDYKGFAHDTNYNELCSSDTLTSLAEGAVCKIDQIVDISAADAKELMSHKK